MTKNYDDDDDISSLVFRMVMMIMMMIMMMILMMIMMMIMMIFPVWCSGWWRLRRSTSSSSRCGGIFCVLDRKEKENESFAMN